MRINEVDLVTRVDQETGDLQAFEDGRWVTIELGWADRDKHNRIVSVLLMESIRSASPLRAASFASGTDSELLTNARRAQFDDADALLVRLEADGELSRIELVNSLAFVSALRRDG